MLPVGENTMWTSRLFGFAAVGLLAATLSISSVQPSAAQDTTPSEDVMALVNGNNAFALNLYDAIASENVGENVFFSPYSVSQALAMVYAGAEGTTAEQMADVLGFSLDEAALHEAFSALNADLTARGNAEANNNYGYVERRLHIANALWGEQSYPFSPDYVALVDQYYGGGFKATDFIGAAEAAREAINEWVADQTEDRIENIVPEGALNEATRLVLANAIYFKNGWLNDFNADATTDDSFFLLDGSTVTVPLMRQTDRFNYVTGEGYQAVALPYQQSRMSMLVILPDEGNFDDFEASLNVDALNALTGSMGSTRVNLTLPKFEFEDSLTLSGILGALGMRDAFSSDAADFAGMVDANAADSIERLFISTVLHKAFIAVDEEGTEAAAATVVAMAGSAMNVQEPDPVVMRVDRPFLFAIRDDVTGTVLFMGRVTNPAS
jgi:serpin B